MINNISPEKLLKVVEEVNRNNMNKIDSKLSHHCTENCKTVVFDEKDIPRWWWFWFKIVRQKGIIGEIPVIRPFEPDWPLFHLMYGGHSLGKVNLSKYLHRKYYELKDIYTD